jgi:hypothetical protein
LHIVAMEPSACPYARTFVAIQSTIKCECSEFDGLSRRTRSRRSHTDRCQHLTQSPAAISFRQHHIAANRGSSTRDADTRSAGPGWHQTFDVGALGQEREFGALFPCPLSLPPCASAGCRPPFRNNLASFRFDAAHHFEIISSATHNGKSVR